MAHATISALALAVVLAPAASVADDGGRARGAPGDASARGGVDRASISDPGVPPDWLAAVPPRCALFTPARGGGDQTHAWRQLLSLAACMQDGAVPSAIEPDEVEVMVEALSARLAPPLLIYLHALEHGDGPVQLRAAFQIGMAYVAFATRARSALAAPPDLATNPAAEQRYREHRDRLEPLLLPARRAAWISFQAIDEAAARSGADPGDEVERNMVCAARGMLPGLADAAPEAYRVRLARGPSCAGAAVTAAR
jgi:hypothetical protein